MHRSSQVVFKAPRSVHISMQAADAGYRCLAISRCCTHSLLLKCRATSQIVLSIFSLSQAVNTCWADLEALLHAFCGCCMPGSCSHIWTVLRYLSCM